MWRNIFFIFMSAGLLIWCGYLIKSRNNFGTKTKLVSAIIFVLWLLTSIIPNFPVFRSPITPSIQGKIIDSATNQPIVSCNILVSWRKSSAFIGTHSEAYKSLFIKTDQYGEFTIPNYMKIVGFHPYPDVYDKYGGIDIVVFDNAHAYKKFSIYNDKICQQYKSTLMPSNNKLLIELDRIVTVNKFFENIFDIYLNYLSVKCENEQIKNDIRLYISSAYDYYISNYSDTKCNEYSNAELIRLSKLFESIGNDSMAISVLKRYKTICPNDSMFVNSEVKRISK